MTRAEHAAWALEVEGKYEEAAFVRQLELQRAELLEALKAAQGYIRFGQDLISADEVISKAITKTEAKE